MRLEFVATDKHCSFNNLHNPSVVLLRRLLDEPSLFSPCVLDDAMLKEPAAAFLHEDIVMGTSAMTSAPHRPSQ